jgi:hypothetical protein
MNSSQFSKNKILICLFLILIGAFAMRVWRINFQSLWLDELHTMNESDPTLTWDKFVPTLVKYDQHPPLYFVIMRLIFSVFGHTEFVARFPSALIGTLAVWLMFLLGKEIRDRELGLLAALATAVNYGCLYYSQEARNYALAFALSALSYLFFIKLIKNPSLRPAIGYSLSTLGLVYTHYFGLFVFCSQLVLMAAIIVITKKDRIRSLGYYVSSCVFIGLAYWPWWPFLNAVTQKKQFWIQSLSHTFVADYFLEYFGKSFLIQPLLVAVLIFFLINAFRDEETSDSKGPFSSPAFAFALLFTWVAVSLLIPYIRSMLMFPILQSRYAIIAVPAMLMAVAYGLRLIRQKTAKAIVVFAFIIFSLVNIIWVKGYYSKVHKAQFREMTQYVIKNNPQGFPIIEQTASWQQAYYFRHFGYKPVVYQGNKAQLVESIIKKEKGFDHVPAFWIISAHLDQPLPADQQRKLEFIYDKIKEKYFFGAWAQFYQIKEYFKNALMLRARDFSRSVWTTSGLDSILLFSGEVHAHPLTLPPGEFELRVFAWSDAVRGEFARIGVIINGQSLGDLVTTNQQDCYVFRFRLNSAKKMDVALALMNDYSDPVLKEDRNAFIDFIVLKQNKPESKSRLPSL